MAIAIVATHNVWVVFQILRMTTDGGQSAAESPRAAGAVWLWLAVAGLWSTLTEAHPAGHLLLAALALLAAALPGYDRTLLPLAAIWTMLAGVTLWQPALGLGPLAGSVLAVFGLRLIAWPAREAAGDSAVDRGSLTRRQRTVGLLLLAGTLFYMLAGASPVASWGMFWLSLLVGGAAYYWRRDVHLAAAISLGGGWLLQLASDVLITDQLWQALLLGVRPGLAWAAVAGSFAGGSVVIGLAAALPQIGLDWPARRPGQRRATGTVRLADLQRGVLVGACLVGFVAVVLPEVGATVLRVADGGVWAASLCWWGLGLVIPAVARGRDDVRSNRA